jgi:maltooligosyltrehalose trehalohydrolase
MTTEFVGATYLGEDRCRFEVWAPYSREVSVEILAPRVQVVPLQPTERGYFCAVVNDVPPAARYVYRLENGSRRPDPASRFQPGGVHEASEVVSQEFNWTDRSWGGLPIQDFILYELHVGTYTLEGSFAGIQQRLDELIDLGITAIELMPVAQFPGDRNWGYDGVYPFAVQNSYGGPAALKALVNTCHARGLAVVLDVVYNHLGPEGNYLSEFGPYFTNRYRTPWGTALNFDGAMSDEVRRFFIENALYWITEFHIDALRLDAVHAIIDQSARPFLGELGMAVHKQAERHHRKIQLIPESDANDARLIQSSAQGGLGLDAQWSDDFHHALRTLLTGERTGYYQDFGELHHLSSAMSEGWTYSGQHSASRQRRHGNSPKHIPADRFVVFIQNHDQIGNRMLGERLGHLVSFEDLKLAAGTVLLSPFIPLLFMGDEYAETAPFQYFVSHTDAELIEAIRRGRSEEFAAFEWSGELPDPQDPHTFLRSKLSRELRQKGQHRELLEFYKELIQLRKTIPALAYLSKDHMQLTADAATGDLFVHRWHDQSQTLVVCRFGKSTEDSRLVVPPGHWRKRLDSSEERWLGQGPTVHTEIISDGNLILSLRPRMLVLFEKAADR